MMMVSDREKVLLFGFSDGSQLEAVQTVLDLAQIAARSAK